MQKRRFMCTICQKKFENSHNKEKHQKHCHTPTLEQLTVHIAHRQNKQKWLECTYEDLHKQNNTLSIQMLHQEKTMKEWQQQLHLLQKNVQEKDSHVTREHMTCVHKEIGHLSLQINKLEWNIQSILTQQEQLKSATKYTKRDQCNTTAIASWSYSKASEETYITTEKRSKEKVYG